ncbi:MAG: sulfatase-like hydrolase/transferase, partial [Patescibacteria group bacterium]
DAVLFFNFRNDRARQLTKAFVLPGFEKFSRAEYLRQLSFVTMTEYEQDLPVSIAYPKEEVTEPLAKVYSDAGLKQLHAAETEKYAHVTFFFNGGVESAFPGEDRVLVPSPAVPTYDQKPDMSARVITERVLQAINTGQYALVIVNYANPDMIGHTGNMPATIRAVEIVDECLGQIVEAALSINGLVLITGDHGNAEAKIDPQTGEVSKEHSANPVPLIVVANDLPPAVLQSYRSPVRDLSTLTPVGVLADIAPTLLGLVGLSVPATMTGHDLFAIR